ncbi:hypothetical protein C8R43DRAFT_1077207 [Mycena crocata]|nr:hypothetical protein C8R43DRAFT_1077207 [Mycena crocata]
MEPVEKLTLPMLIGTLLNWGLFGTLLVQTYIYFSAFPKDRRASKLLVAGVFALELIETAANTRDMIHIFGVGWGTMDALDDVGWAWFSVPVLGSVNACVGQLFFAWRIYIISHNIYLSGLVISISLVQLAAGVWTGINICLAKKFSLLQDHNLKATATWLAATALCDLVIVVSIVFYLVASRRREFRKTNSILSRIIRVTVETGVVCALFALVDLYLFATYKGTNFHLALCIELGKIYSNSILLVLNSRARIRHTPEINPLRSSDIVFESGAFQSGLPDSSSEPHHSMNHEIITKRDETDGNVNKYIGYEC